MRLLLIRHGDPDYVHDTLTPKGDREAEELAQLLAKEHIDCIYKSPRGRAQKTASYTEKITGLTGTTFEWLQEFPGRLDIHAAPWLEKAYPDWESHHDAGDRRIFWDMLPGELMKRPEILDAEKWRHSELAGYGDIVNVYDHVTEEFDRLLAEWGYVRSGGLYHVEKANDKTLAFFCHFGLNCVLLSHLWQCSPFMTWHMLGMAPSSVTELVTEERQPGIAVFRALRIGDISHLRVCGDTPSFAGRFCETYEDASQRH